MQSADKKRKRNEPIDLFPPQDKEAKKIYNKVSRSNFCSPALTPSTAVAASYAAHWAQNKMDGLHQAVRVRAFLSHWISLSLLLTMIRRRAWGGRFHRACVHDFSAKMGLDHQSMGDEKTGKIVRVTMKVCPPGTLRPPPS